MKRNLHIDNRTLVEECLKGDKEAFNLFYVRFAPKMLGVIRRYVADSEDAEDILHDGFIVAFTRLKSIRDYDRVEFWLATIMKNLSLQFLNSQDLTAMLHDLPEVADTPDIDEIIDLDTIERLIGRLPDGYQKVFRLAVLEHKSHKEIGRLLGISPSTSSSQLFHARLMMRRLINDYRKETGLFSALLLAAVGAGLIWYIHSRREIPATVSPTELISATKAEEAVTDIQPPAGIADTDAGTGTDGAAAARRTGPRQSAAITVSVPASREIAVIVPDSTAETAPAEPASLPGRREETAPDTIRLQSADPGSFYAYAGDLPGAKRRRGNWEIAVGVNPGGVGILGSEDELMFDYFNPEDPGIGDTPSPDESAQAKVRSVVLDYRDVAHHNDMPLTAAISLNRRITERISIESGLTYTYLHTRFESNSTVSDCRWHYLGVPLRLNVTMHTTSRIRLYGTVGGAVDIPLYSAATATDRNGGLPVLAGGRFSSPVVWSISAGCGLSFRISQKFDIFVQPTVSYHFRHDADVPNIWTDEPWTISFPIGLRFNW